MNNFIITEELLKELFKDSGENFIFYPEIDGQPIEVNFDDKDFQYYEKIERMKTKKRNFEEWRKNAGF